MDNCFLSVFPNAWEQCSQILGKDVPNTWDYDSQTVGNYHKLQFNVFQLTAFRLAFKLG